MSWDAVMDWAWARHANEWSWHARPVIILAFCLAAYLRSRFGVVLCALLFPLSAVMFPAPANPSPEVLRFLALERALLEAATPVHIAVFLAVTVGFLWLLAAAFWRRSLWLGLLVANLASVAKVAGSVWLWPEDGWTVLRPALVTVVAFNVVVLLASWAWRRFRRLRSAPSGDRA